MRWQIILLLSFTIAFAVFGSLLPFSFTQDDFFLLRQATFNTVWEQLQASLPRVDSIYFRPLGMQGYFYVGRRILGVHPWAFRTVSLIIHSTNATLVFLLARKILRFSHWIVWFLYLTAPLHFAAIGWVANTSFMTGTALVLTSLLIFEQKNSRRVLCLVLFIAALLTNELAVVLPFVLLIFTWWVKRKISLPKKEDRTFFIALLIVEAAYIGFRLLTVRFVKGPYALSVGRHVFGNIRWFLLWIVGWVESSKDYFIGPFSIRWDFFQTFRFETTLTIIVTILMAVLVTRALLKNRFYSLGIIWFVGSILPMAFFRHHISPHYAMIGSIGLYLVIGYACETLPRFGRIAVVVLWAFQSISAARLNLVTHWWVQHADLSRTLTRQIQERYPSLPQDKVIVVESQEPDRAEIVLSQDNAVQLIYNDPAAKTLFLKRFQ